jgi:hypothetical protein
MILLQAIFFSMIFFISANKSNAEVTVAQSADGAVVKIDGQLFTEYLNDSGGKPILWPIIGPTGKALTRAYPMNKNDANEKKDHPHHRSMWFTHGSVDGIDFWTEKTGNGIIKHRDFAKL